MSPKQSRLSEQPSLAAQVAEPAEQPFVDAGRALLKAGFLFANHRERPYFAFDLTLAQLDVLVTLAQAEGASLNCSEIAEKTLITKGGITGILDRLEARGMVRRVHSREDRRSVLIQLSAKGVEIFRKLYPELQRHNRTLLEKAFSRAQTKDFSTLLNQLIRTLEKE
jgi:MarR family transcriptional regulator, 2-MHQ and catechol-resistance regulon repressor